jgi:hypothetical protein
MGTNRGVIKIMHPKANQHVRPCFAAYGEVKKAAAGFITGAIYLDGKKIAEGYTQKSGHHWVVFFQDVAFTPHGKVYKLTITGSAPGVSADRDFVVGGSYSPVVDYPTAESQLCSTFTSYGTTTSPVPMTAVMSSPSQGNFNGTVLQGPPDTKNWIIQFTDLPDATDYDLNVTDGTGTQPVNKLTVDSDNC